MADNLSNKFAKKFVNGKVLVQFIVEDVVACFLIETVYNRRLQSYIVPHSVCLYPSVTITCIGPIVNVITIIVVEICWNLLT